MGGEADAVIGQAVLGKIVGPNFFVPFSCADLLAAGSFHLAPFLLPFFLEKAGGENPHGGSTIFDLRAAVLAADDETGGDVENLYG